MQKDTHTAKGDELVNEVQAEVQECEVVLVLISPGYQTSRRAVHELHQAGERGT